MKTAWMKPTLGVFLAIGITAAMDATGLTAFSALPLLPLMLLFWYIERLPRQHMGFSWGRWQHYGLAALYPVAVLSLVALAAAATGAVNVSQVNWQKAALNVVLVTISTFLVVILTEEGFFRGWLWASLEKAGLTQSRVLVLSSIAFSLWHLSWVTLTSDGKLSLAQIPVYMVNATVIGAIWGVITLDFWLSDCRQP